MTDRPEPPTIDAAALRASIAEHLHAPVEAVRDDRGMWHPERIREQLRERLFGSVEVATDAAAKARLARAVKLAEGLVQAGFDDPVGAAIARLPLGAKFCGVIAGPEPGDVSLGYTLTQAEAKLGHAYRLDPVGFAARLADAVARLPRTPKPSRRGKTRRSRQVRSTRARAKRRVEQREARAEVVAFEVRGYKFTARRDRQHAVESILRERIERASPRGAW